MTERHTTPVVLALEALKYALDVALGDEWNVGELQIPEGDKRAGVGLIAVRKMRAAIYALETVVPSESAFIEIGEMVEIPDGFGVQPNTVYCEWNEMRSKIPAGTKIYVRR